VCVEKRRALILLDDHQRGLVIREDHFERARPLYAAFPNVSWAFELPQQTKAERRSIHEKAHSRNPLGRFVSLGSRHEPFSTVFPDAMSESIRVSRGQSRRHNHTA